jgi:hypothetical protein
VPAAAAASSSEAGAEQGEADGKEKENKPASQKFLLPRVPSQAGKSGVSPQQRKRRRDSLPRQ